MATVASLVANSIFLRNPHPKFSAAKLSATYDSRHASVSFSSAPKFNVDLRLKSFFSAAENNQYITCTADSKVLGSHASLCKPPNAIKVTLVLENHLDGSVGSDRRSIRTTLSRGTLATRLETIVAAFLRHQKCHTSASVSVCSKFGREAANTYDKLSINERVNNKESLVNVNDMKMQSSTRSANDWHNDDIMGCIEWPAYDLKNALQELRLIASSNNITAVEVLWTPQASSCLTATST